MKPSPKRGIKTVLRRILGVIILLILWECNAHFEMYKVVSSTLPGSFFPSLTSIGSKCSSILSDTSYHEALLLTTFRTVLGFLIAATLGIVCALLAARIAIVDDLIHYPFEFFRQLPAVAILPFAIIVFGIYTKMKIAVAVFGSFFPVFLATREGLKNVGSELMLTARSYNWRGAKLIFGVMLPAAVPHILASLRIALAIALILVVMGEMLVGGDGLGGRIVDRERGFDFPGMYAETILLGFLGVVLSLGLEFVSRQIYYWRDDVGWRAA